MPKKVLLIAFFFPPLGGAGSQRPTKFAKYLPLHGWTSVVLTSRSTDYHCIDPGLEEELPDACEIRRTGIVELKPLYEWMYKLGLNGLAHVLRKQETKFMLPDRRIGWLPFAYLAGVEAIRRQGIDAILSTSAPFTCHLIGYLLKRRSNLPWIADFRDEWTDTPYFQYGPINRRLNLGLEGLVLRNADRVSCVNQELTRLMSAKRPAAERQKFVTLPNGYDEEDIRPALAAAGGNSARFIITHVGTFYALRKPDLFLKALAELIRRRQIDGRDIEVRFVGGAADPALIAALGLEGIVRNSDGFVAHRAALRCMAESTVLLLIIRREGSAQVTTGKLFEYLAMGKPILAVGGSGSEAGRIIQAARSGVVVESEDVGEISAAILQLYRQWKQETLSIEPDWAEIRKYDRKVAARSLAAQLDSLVVSG